MIFGYARVSTDAQDLAVQRGQLKAAGCVQVCGDTLTGTTPDRPQLMRLMSKLREGDTVIIPAVDRLARDPTDLLVIARDMRRIGAGLKSLAESAVDTTSDFAEVVFAILGVAANLERQRTLDRTARGYQAAKARGVEYGRKPKLPLHQRQEASAHKESGEPVRDIASSYAVNHSMISRLTGPAPARADG